MPSKVISTQLVCMAAEVYRQLKPVAFTWLDAWAYASNSKLSCRSWGHLLAGKGLPRRLREVRLENTCRNGGAEWEGKL